MATLDLQVGASTDDANENYSTGDMYTFYTSVVLGAYSFWRHSGLRFTGVSGLSGATINAGTELTFRAKSGDTGGFVADWYAHKAAAPGTFTTTDYNITDTAQRPRTTATCEGDGADYGPWTEGQDYDFAGDGVNTIADIIQELLDPPNDFDPSAIVLLSIYGMSGTGERVANSYDQDSATAPKLWIDFTAATGDVIATPEPVVVPIAIPAPGIVAGAATLTPDPVAVPVFIPIASGIAGAVTATPDPVVVPIAHPTPTAVAGPVIATPAPVVMPIFIPVPDATSVGLDRTLFPDPVVVPISLPAPTVVIGGATLTPDPVVIPIVLPVPSVNITAVPDAVVIPIGIPSPSVTIGGVIATPSPVEIPIVIPLPSIEGGGEQFVAWGIWDADTQTWLGIEQYGDPGDFAPGSLFRLYVGMYTASPAVPIKAYLYNITDGLKVPGSDLTGTATSYEILRSATPFNLPSAGVQPKKYRLEYGGEVGGTFYFHGGKARAESS